MWETQVRSLGQEHPLEKEMVTHSSTLAWKIPWATIHGVSESDTTVQLHFFHSSPNKVTLMSFYGLGSSVFGGNYSACYICLVYSYINDYVVGCWLM